MEGLQTVVARLARERDFLETLFDTIEDGVLVLDGKAHISWHNQSAEHLLSLPLDKAEGQGLAKFLPGLDGTSFAPRNPPTACQSRGMNWRSPIPFAASCALYRSLGRRGPAWR